jgi:hypothetical protein
MIEYILCYAGSFTLGLIVGVILSAIYMVERNDIRKTK